MALAALSFLCHGPSRRKSAHLQYSAKREVSPLVEDDEMEKCTTTWPIICTEVNGWWPTLCQWTFLPAKLKTKQGISYSEFIAPCKANSASYRSCIYSWCAVYVGLQDCQLIILAITMEPWESYSKITITHDTNREKRLPYYSYNQGARRPRTFKKFIKDTE